MSARQQTLAGEVTLDGHGVHSGLAARLSLKPAAPDTGVVFRRVDLEGAPEVPATLDHVADTRLGTTIQRGEARIMTVEHVMAALVAAEVDNVRVEVDGPEVPIRDGSFRDYFDAVRGVGMACQDVPARVLRLPTAGTVAGEGGERYVFAPAPHLAVTATIDFPHPSIGRQSGAFEVDAETFHSQIAAARTFGFEADAQRLRAEGLARGASLENSIVLGEDGILNDDLRFPDEFLRHKVGDLVGDLGLLGARLQAHVVAERPSHAGNISLARTMAMSARRDGREPVVDITRIMEILPHRYPMLLVDRITHYEPGRRVVGIKNVTINEPFFQGHFPGHPVMPGVLIVEAMAQVGGLLLMDEIEDPQSKVVYFMSLDNVKWRKPVVPGDTVVFELELLHFRRRICRMRGEGFVDGELVAEAELMATIVDR